MATAAQRKVCKIEPTAEWYRVWNDHYIIHINGREIGGGTTQQAAWEAALDNLLCAPAKVKERR